MATTLSEVAPAGAVSLSAAGAIPPPPRKSYFAFLWSVGPAAVAIAAATVAAALVLTSSLTLGAGDGAAAVADGAVRDILRRLPPPTDAAGIAAALAHLVAQVMGYGARAVASVTVGVLVGVPASVGVAAWAAARATDEPPPPPSSGEGGDVAARSGGGGGSWGGASDRRWLMAVAAAYAVLLGWLASLWSLDEAYKWRNVSLALATVGLQGGLLALLVGRVVLPASLLADWGLASSAAQAAAAERGLRGCAMPDPFSGGALDWSATGRWLVAEWAWLTGALFAIYATPGMILLGILGVLVCLPATTPLLVAGAVVGVLCAGGMAFLIAAVRGSVAVARARQEGGGVGGGGHDSLPPGTPLLPRQRTSVAAA